LLIIIMVKKLGLVWIREDFRITRNYALSSASKDNDSVVAFYIFKEKKFEDKEAQKWWLSKSLSMFKSDLKDLNINLQIIRAESYQSVFQKLINKKDYSIYWNKIYEPVYLNFDNYLKKIFHSKDISYKICKGNILNEFTEVKKDDNTPYRVFTPFWRNAEKFYIDKVPILNHKVKKKNKILKYFENEMNENEILPKKKWYQKFESEWSPSELDAKKKLKEFLNNKIDDYSNNRNYPNISGTSKLSPFIKHGQLHVETIWEEIEKIKRKKKGIDKFIAEIGWREFSHSMINYFPKMLKENYSKKFDKFPWEKNSKLFNSWKDGLTGYPIVDAGMRELSKTGWMHNRVRMIVGSFLVKHLLIDWKLGEKHFRNCLFDFSEANNVSGWQWVAGCGADAAPYFRIFNPILQGEKFDSKGEYVKKWVPEIKLVPDKFVHKPWEYKSDQNFIPGKNYPLPIVNHEVARSKALNAFKKIK